MAKKKPTVTPRKPVPVPEASARALEDRWAQRDALPAGVPLPPPTDTTSKRPDASAEDRRLVVRKGRILADGSRTEAPPRLRLTVYLDPSLGRRLDVLAATHGRERSSIVAEALAEYLERLGG